MTTNFECYCFLIETKNNKRFAYTSLDSPVTIGSDTYLPVGGLEATATSQTTGTDIDNLRLTIFQDNTTAGITKRYIDSGAIINATCTIAVVNFIIPPASLAGGYIVLRGFVGNASIDETCVELEILNNSTPLNNGLNVSINANCRYQLGDSRCQVDLTTNDRTQTSTVTGFTPFGAGYQITLASGTFIDRFIGGTLTFTSGDNSGMIYRIINVSGTTITIDRETPEDIQIGDAVEVVIGCRKDDESCEFFNNLLNFGGGYQGTNHFRSIDDVNQL